MMGLGHLEPTASEKTETGRARLSFARQADVDEFVDVLGQFERGDITPDQWRAFRLLRGTYGQRQAEDAQMIHVKIPQGVLTGAQIEALADVADRYSRGFGHITTRQNVQFHFVKLHDVERAMRRMAEAGLWAGTNVRPQKQARYAIVTVATLLGDLTAEQMRLLARLALAFGDGAVRVTMEQNAVFRWVPSADVAALYEHLAAAGLARGGAGTLADVVSCPGAESCRLAVTQSRGLGRLLADTLAERADLVERLPARRAFEALERLTDLYVETRAPGESARAFFRRVELPLAKAAPAPLGRLSPEAATPEDFIDIGEDHAFTPEVMDGECSA